ncbi:hypothetical protein GCM10023087_30660 [Microbacterium rhizosphaerae]
MRGEANQREGEAGKLPGGFPTRVRGILGEHTGDTHASSVPDRALLRNGPCARKEARNGDARRAMDGARVGLACAIGSVEHM